MAKCGRFGRDGHAFGGDKPCCGHVVWVELAPLHPHLHPLETPPLDQHRIRHHRRCDSPLMGWMASEQGRQGLESASTLLSDPTAYLDTMATAMSSPQGLTLAAIMFFWQMQHFMALAWQHREDYAGAGYQMVSHPHTDPHGDATFLKGKAYAAALTGLPVLTTVVGVTTIHFPLLAVPAAAYTTYQWFKFDKDRHSRQAYGRLMGSGYMLLIGMLAWMWLTSTNPDPIVQAIRKKLAEACVFLLLASKAAVTSEEWHAIVDEWVERHGESVKAQLESAAAVQAVAKAGCCWKRRRKMNE
eukprot:GABV01000432.1.p2 GENE.GABV01000432.1~~GABV01000432.1.p2  ORF type:complete len:300 (+),score=61.97 GABV01000432.1:385-1284(+)